MVLALIVRTFIESAKMEHSVSFLVAHMIRPFSMMVIVSHVHFIESLVQVVRNVFFLSALTVKLLQRQDYVSLVHHFNEAQTVNSDVMTKLVQPMKSFKKMVFAHNHNVKQINSFLTKELAKTVLIILFHPKLERCA
jgi:hypothetical protein